jgi:hypothetical protein
MKLLVLDSDNCEECPFLFSDQSLIKEIGICKFGGRQRDLKSLNNKENGCELPDYKPTGH